MSLSPAFIKLADAVSAFWQSGVEIDADSRHFMETVYGVSDPEEQLALLWPLEQEQEGQDDDPPEVDDGLLELLFFPGPVMRLAVEERIQGLEIGEDEGISADTLKEMAAFLAPEDRVEIPVRLEDREGKAAVSAEFVQGVLRRLNLDFRIPARIAEALTGNVDADTAVDIAVRMRTAREPKITGGVAFLARVVEELGKEADIRDLFSYALGTVSDAADGGNMYSELMTRKRRLTEGLRQAKRLEKQLQKSTMETLMMQGVRVLYIDQDDARRQMALIDRIAMAIFRRTESFDIIEYHMEAQSEKELMDQMAD